jgi:hypothetical protein
MAKKQKFQPKFLVDDDGHKTGVLLKISDFEKIMEELEDYYDYMMAEKRSRKNYKTHTKEEVLAEIFGKR